MRTRTLNLLIFALCLTVAAQFAILVAVFRAQSMNAVVVPRLSGDIPMPPAPEILRWERPITSR